VVDEDGIYVADGTGVSSAFSEHPSSDKLQFVGIIVGTSEEVFELLNSRFIVGDNKKFVGLEMVLLEPEIGIGADVPIADGAGIDVVVDTTGVD
jgi:hypothetical protein